MPEHIFFDRYLIHREIARGGMGIVYLALDQTLNREVAIKVLHAHLMGEPSFARKFLKEARTMAMLDHKNIIKIFTVEESEQGHSLIMEFFPSVELKKIIKERGKLGLKRAIHFAIGITQALIYAHSKEVIHRDIKPGNILVGEHDVIKLTDFGIADVPDDSHATTTGMVMGTPEYMAPEQARGEKPQGETDLYSLGVVLYEMVTGTTPYKGMPAQTIVGKLGYDPQEMEWPFPEEVPTPLQNLIRMMTKKHPKERFKDSSLLLETLHHYFDDLPDEGPPPIPDDDKTILVSTIATPNKKEIHEQMRTNVPPPEISTKPSLPSQPSSFFSWKPNMAIWSLITLLLVVGGTWYFWIPSDGPGVQPKDTLESSQTEAIESTHTITDNEVLGSISQMNRLHNEWETLYSKGLESQRKLDALHRQIRETLRPGQKTPEKDYFHRIQDEIRNIQTQRNQARSLVESLQTSTDQIISQNQSSHSEISDSQLKLQLSETQRSLDTQSSKTLEYFSNTSWNQGFQTLVDTVNKWERLTIILDQIREAYIDHDLTSLQSLTELSTNQATVLRALFTHWPSFTVTTSIETTSPDSAHIILQLRDMINRQGEPARRNQENIIGRQHLALAYHNGKWSKPRWL